MTQASKFAMLFNTYNTRTRLYPGPKSTHQNPAYIPPFPSSSALCPDESQYGRLLLVHQNILNRAYDILPLDILAELLQ